MHFLHTCEDKIDEGEPPYADPMREFPRAAAYDADAATAAAAADEELVAFTGDDIDPFVEPIEIDMVPMEGEEAIGVIEEPEGFSPLNCD